MKKKKKIFYTFFITLGFSYYFYQVALHFQFTCSQPTTIQKNLLKSVYQSFVETQNMEFCINVYATLFLFSEEEQIVVENLLSNLNSTINIPVNSFQIDSMVSPSGLPLHYCNLFKERKCLADASPMTCKQKFKLRRIPGHIKILASFDNYNISTMKLHNNDDCCGKAVTWPLMQNRTCDDFNHEKVIHMVSSYHKLLTSGNLFKNLSCSTWSFCVVSVFLRPDIFSLLKSEIPKLYQNPTHFHHINRVGHIQKRSVMKPSPVIAPPVPSTPVLPMRASLFPLPMESTPIFSNFNPSFLFNFTSNKKDINANNNSSSNGATNPSVAQDGNMTLPEGNQNPLSSSDIAKLHPDTKNVEEESGSSGGEGSFESGGGLTHLTLVESRTNLSHFNTAHRHTLLTLLINNFTTNRILVTKPFGRVDYSSKIVEKVTEINQALKTDVFFTSHSQISTKPLFATIMKSKVKFHQSKQTHFIPVTSPYFNSSKAFHINDVTALYTVNALSTTNGPLSYSLTATVGKIFMYDLPSNWETYLKEPNAKINFSENDVWVIYEPRLMKIVGVPLISNKKSFALLMDINASYLSEYERSLSLMVQVHSKTILSNPAYVVETNFSVSAEHFWKQQSVKQAAISYTSAIFILRLSRYLTRVEMDDISIISVMENGRGTGEGIALPSSYISIRWFVEKFTPRTFIKHYKSLIINPETEEVSRNFFFALLPDFILDSAVILDPVSKSVGTDLNLDSKFNDNQISLSVALPVIAVLCLLLLVSILFIVRYRRKKQRFTKDALADKTFAKRRKPVCFREELEMCNVRPSKPKIFTEDLKATPSPRNWKETIFSASCDSPSSSSANSVVVSSDPLSNEWNALGQGSSGSYSFINACFVPYDDCESLASVREEDKDELASKKGD